MFLFSSVAVCSQSPRFQSISPSPDWTSPESPANEITGSLQPETADAASLLSLATEERLSGDLEQAHRTYMALRSEFQSSVEAGHAAFWLGEMEFSDQKDYPKAASWFEVYLREWPRGAFSARAQARLMESLIRSGDVDGAIRLANQCFAEHGNGSESEVTSANQRSEASPE